MRTIVEICRRSSDDSSASGQPIQLSRNPSSQAVIKRRRAVIRRRPDVSWRWAWDCEDNCRNPSTIRRRHLVVWAAYTA